MYWPTLPIYVFVVLVRLHFAFFYFVWSLIVMKAGFSGIIFGLCNIRLFAIKFHSLEILTTVWCSLCTFVLCFIIFVVSHFIYVVVVVVVVVDPTPPTCCQQSPAPEIMWQPAVSPPRWQGKAPLCRDSSRGPG